MKYMTLLIFIFCYMVPIQAEILDENDFNEKTYEVLFSNQSILECGGLNHLNIYSSFDIEVLLLISNELSSTKLTLQTNWNNFHPPAFTSVNFNETHFKTLPDDIKRILFLCLTWNESDRLNLFTIPDDTVGKINKRLRSDRPWKNLDAKFAKKAESLSDATLNEFIYIVLRANVFESVRGNLLNNKSLFFIPWNWLTVNPGAY